MDAERGCGKTAVVWSSAAICVALFLLVAAHRAGAQSPRVIEVLADHDSRYKIAGEKDPSITVHAGKPSRCGLRRSRPRTTTGTGRYMASRCFARKTDRTCPDGILS
jgi:hypothetical protein